jgi:hypothetical protein
MRLLLVKFWKGGIWHGLVMPYGPLLSNATKDLLRCQQFEHLGHVKLVCAWEEKA